MANSLEHFAARVADDPFFLACPLALFAKSEGMSEEQLVAWFHCSQESLVMMRLCRAPEAESATFFPDIRRIAERFSVEADVLAEVVRRGQAIYHMTAGGDSVRTLRAARDRDEKEPVDSMEEDNP